MTTSIGGAYAATGNARALTVYSWSEYMDPELVGEFETEFGAEIQFSYFDSDEQRDKELTASGGTGFDVILVNGVQMQRYVKHDWIAPLDSGSMPNVGHLDPHWSEAFNGATAAHGAAYFWGTLGIAWRSDLYPRGVNSWQELLEPDPALSGRIMMSGYGRELVGFALKADGHSINTVDRSLIRAAGEKLLRQKPHVQSYGYPSLTEGSSLLTGEIWVTPMYNGDALVLKELDERIEYRIPEEGGLLWVDYLTVAESSTRKPLAMAFIDFLNRPEVAARNAEYVSYATPNLAAGLLLSEEYLADPTIYPSKEQMEALEFFKALPPRSKKSLNSVVSTLFSD